MPDTEPVSAVPPARVRLSLKAKLSLVITVLVVSTIALVAAVLLHQEQRTLTEEMTKRGLTIATGLAASAKGALPARDEPALNLLVKDVMRSISTTSGSSETRGGNSSRGLSWSSGGFSTNSSSGSSWSRTSCETPMSPT